MKLVVDIEANGLHDDVTKVHCVVIMDRDTGVITRYYGDVGSNSIKEAVLKLNEADIIYGHNWIDFDAYVLKKFYPEYNDDPSRVRDTLVLSYMSNPHRKRHPDCPPSKVVDDKRRPIGAHSLENIGYIVGRGKVEHEDWSVFTDEMLHRCVEDVVITNLWVSYLEEEMGDHDWHKSIMIENWFRYIISKQERYGWLFDIDKARDTYFMLEDTMADIEKQFHDSGYLIMKAPKINETTKEAPRTRAFKKDGKRTVAVEKWYNNLDVRQFRLKDVAGDFTKVSFEPMNLKSAAQVKDYLFKNGWEPDEWNYKTDASGKEIYGSDGSKLKASPKLTDSSMSNIPFGPELSKHSACSTKLSVLEGWLSKVRPDGRMGAGGNTCGTNTGRVTHRVVVNVPKVGEFCGEEMRSMFTCKPGYSIVGADLSALENKLMGHFTYRYDDGEYARRLEEADPHNETVALIKDKFGLEIERFKAKTLNYALGYGATAGKVAQVLFIDKRLAEDILNAYWEDRKPMKLLKEDLIYALESRGMINSRGRLLDHAWIRGIDGRRIYVRSKHSIVNALIQNAGSVINKMWTIYIYKFCQKYNVDANFVGNFHDENQCEVLNEHIDIYSKIVVDSVKAVTQKLDLKIPMETDVNVGDSWARTH